MLNLKQSIFSYSPKWYRAKFQVGFLSALFVPLHSVCSKRLHVVQSAHDKDEGETETQICLEKEQYIRGTGLETSCKCIYTHFYTEKECIHTCTEE